MTDPTGLRFAPIGHVEGGRAEATKDGWGPNRSRIVIDDPRLSPDCLMGLQELSHIEVLYHFHRHADEPAETGARHPRGNPDWPRVGIFAQRARMRPNRIGLCSCRVLSVQGLSVEVEGLDAVDGTPVLDIKPVWAATLPRGELKEPAWACDLMANYW